MITFLSILAVGFFLGMRHATDPDHVIAVTTIVSDQRNSMRAALIGAFWGVGHTLTILVVGAGIILFNLVIPVRLGLSMELSVAVMLIVLGVINVAGFLRSMPGTLPHNSEQEAIVHTHPHIMATSCTAIRTLTNLRAINIRPSTRRWRGWTGHWERSACINICGLWWWVSFTVWLVPRPWLCWF